MVRKFTPCALLAAALGTAHAALLTFTAGESDFKLAATGLAPVIQVASNDWPAVKRVAQDLAADFGRVVGTNGTVSDSDSSSDGRPVVIVGTIGNSTLIDGLVSANKIDVSATAGKWESYVSQLVKEPVEGVPWALVIAGSDRRGAVYGIYDVSEAMGVSPLYWWADVPVKTKPDGVWVTEEKKVQGPPSVKYRGFFINDEAPALQSWINRNTGGFNSQFYRLVFELCLRLKGNFLIGLDIWPAMWGRMFYVEDPKNGPLAEEFGVVMGTSHHEPMSRSEEEQKRYNQGNWDWSSNRNSVTNFFKDGISRARNWETMWTMGMRGSGDEASPTLNPQSLEQIIQVQQQLLSETYGTTDMATIPQTWVLYKEVLGYYTAGMKVPDTVTLLWTDDNSGNILRVPTAAERDRVAGAGVYYHFDYVGSPRNYKWINSIQLVKTWEQMQLAYEKNARQIWIVNVGDIKPLEIPLLHFMDMAYNMDAHKTPDSTTAWLKRWASREFGDAVADVTAEIMNEYGILLMRRKYELLSEQPFAFSTANYDEAERHLAQWEDLLTKAQAAYEGLDSKTQVSYFQMVYHPVLAGKTVVDLYIKVALNDWRSRQGRLSANTLAAQARALFARDEEITQMYHSLNGGKWNGFVNQPHIGYDNWQDPNSNIMPSVKNVTAGQGQTALGVAIQGSSTSFYDGAQATLLAMDPFMSPTEQRYIDVFARKDGNSNYTIVSNATYVTVSNGVGSITSPGDSSEIRSILSVDWEAAPAGTSYVSLRVRSDCKLVATVLVPITKTEVPATFRGHVESGGVVSMEAAHFSSAEEKNGVSYIEIPHYGRTLSGIKLWPVTVETQTAESGPALKYSVYTTTSSSQARLVVMLGAALNHDPTRLLRLAWSMDGGAPAVVQPVSTQPPYQEGREWRTAVVGGGWNANIQINGTVAAGAHTISLWLMEPGVVVQKVVLDMGGMKASALGPHASKRV
ncbi:hypothetical protein M0657_005941 [Pyricularia oryzae]|uniref:Gylcosyl hydrolase 115 C-terminal domain-containing protein n=2 Tax=Pyricularia oryzae TaxID=318829 RepID=A0AA97PHQ5_PYRO3|nr:hypothetical protein OOU_Y34scaffold00726g3 [Pyricularia oryzae Y34]KAI7921749.1 hypothetical protein M0657_005941 [Pyricularia oryzae]